MSGFDNGTLHDGIKAQAKQLGAILRGFGPPVPQAGVLGDLYLDTQTEFLYGKREEDGVDPWGNYFYQVPAAYQSTLKWFSSSLPPDSVGVDGDYCLLWGGYNDYGLQPLIFGPKINGAWPESGDGPDLLLEPAYAGYTLPVGMLDEGSPVIFSSSTQLVVTGLLDEFIIATPVSQVANSPVTDTGLRSTPAAVAVNLNPLYAVNKHGV